MSYLIESMMIHKFYLYNLPQKSAEHSRVRNSHIVDYRKNLRLTLIISCFPVFAARQ